MINNHPTSLFNETERINALHRYNILDTPPDGSFDRITSMAAKLIKVPIAIVSLVDSDRIWFKSHHGLDIQQIDRSPGLCASAILSQELYVITDASKDVRSLTNPLVVSEFGLRFYAAAPLTTHDGYNLGTLCVIDKQIRSISTEELEILKDLAAVVMDQIELRLAARNIDWLNSELKQEIIERKRAESMAQKANQAKSEFLANMSHELRTPLNGILGYAQIMQRDKDATPKQLDGINIIYQCGSHLLTLINDILDLSKIEAKKLELYPKDFHLATFLQGVAEICRIKAEQKEIAFRVQTLNQLPAAIHADEKRLRQVLINLLGNAIKFTDTGSVTFKVGVIDTSVRVKEIESGEENAETNNQQPTTNNQQPTTHKIRFQVEDTGIGMNPNQLSKIFLPFEQVGDGDRKVEGTGLGLTISQKIVQMMGSQFQVESTPGVGSKFWFDLDLPEATEWIELSSTKTVLNIKGYEGEKKRILVVDDRWENRSIIVNLLEPIGFEVIEASNGKEGLKRVVERQPSLIITDLVMPIINGFEMTRQLRQIPDFREIVVIASSASVFKFDRQKSQESGCNDFLPKPLQSEELLEKLEHYLGLVWVYEQDELETIHSQSPGNIDSLSSPSTPNAEINDPSGLVIPPSVELISLYEAAQIGQIRGIREEAIRLEQLDVKYKPFAAKVLKFAQNFEDEEVVKLLDPYLADQSR